jgi:beta-galactosidase
LIDCGALGAGASPDKHFGSDTFFEGGTAQMIAGPGNGFRAPTPVSIAGTTSPAVAATYRTGTFTYRIPAADGPHSVVLTFVEPSLHPGDRIFDVFANGQRVLSNLDVAAAAGGALTAYQQHFEVSARDGMVMLEFKPTKGDAIVSAIELQ